MTVKQAYAEMKKRGWVFKSNGKGFGDPHATYTMVGPYDGNFIEIYGMNKNCVKAVQLAIEKAKAKALN